MDNKVSAKNYRELIVWQEGIKLAKAAYKLTEKFPRQEMYARAHQFRRAAVVDTQLILAQEFGYLNKEDIAVLDEQIQTLRKKALCTYQ